MTREQFERIVRSNPHDSSFGTITKVDRYPVIEIKYFFDGSEPIIIGQREIATITEVEGAEPELTGTERIGDSALSQIVVSELHTWKAFENELRRVLDEEYDKQHGKPPGTPGGGPPQEEATLVLA